MISSVTNVNGGKRVSITNNGKVVIDLPEGFMFTASTVGSSTIVSIRPKDGVYIVNECCRKHPLETKNFEVDALPWKGNEENSDVIRKKRQISPRLTPEQKADVIKMYREGMGKMAIAKNMKITYQQVIYCLKTLS